MHPTRKYPPSSFAEHFNLKKTRTREKFGYTWEYPFLTKTS